MPETLSIDEEMALYWNAVRELNDAYESGSDTVKVTYRPHGETEPRTEQFIVASIGETRGHFVHHLLVREPDDSEQLIFVIPLADVIRIEPIEQPQ